LRIEERQKGKLGQILATRRSFPARTPRRARDSSTFPLATNPTHPPRMESQGSRDPRE
jgi:hypothetical protein